MREYEIYIRSREMEGKGRLGKTVCIRIRTDGNMWWLCQLNLSISNAGLSHAAYLRGSGSDSRKKAALNDAQTHTHTTKKEGVS